MPPPGPPVLHGGKDVNDEPSDEWLSVPNAALRLGVSESAIRSRVGRRTLRTRKDNRGLLAVFIGDIPTKFRTFTGELSVPSPQPVRAAPETIPLSQHQAEIERLQAAHNDTVATYQLAIAGMEQQIKQLRTDHAAERAHTASEMARQLVKPVLTAIGQALDQHLADVSEQQRRVSTDMASQFAKSSAQRLDQVLDRLGPGRREGRKENPRRPWWRWW